MLETKYLNSFYDICIYDYIKNETKYKNISTVYEFINNEYQIISEDEAIKISKELSSEKVYFEKGYILDLIKKLENRLFESAESNPENIISFLALRCRVSNLISKSLKNKFQKIDFTRKPVGFYDELKRELYPNALLDNGQKLFKIEVSKDVEKNLPNDLKDILNKKGIPINWNLKNIKKKIEEYNYQIIEDENELNKNQSPKNYKKELQKLKNIKLPLGIEILFDFNNTLASLATWVNIKFRSNKEIKEILSKFKIDSESYWSKLTTISVSRLKEAWELNSKAELPKYLETLLISYKERYVIAKNLYKDKYKRSYGWTPDENFLSSLEPPQNNIDNLKLIIKIYSFIERREIGLQNNQADNKEADEFEDFRKKEVIEIIFQFLLDNLQEIVNKKFDKLKPDFLINPYRKFIWKKYGECLSQREIAVLCGKSQTTVFRELKEVKSFISDICLEILPCFEKKLNLFNTKKSFNKNDYKKSKFQNFDKEYLKEILKEFSQKIRNIRNEPSEIDSYNDYFYEVLTSPSKSDSMKYKKSSYFQELVRKYFENE